MFNPGNGSTETVVCTADIDAIETAAAEEVWRIMVKSRESVAKKNIDIVTASGS